MIGLSLLCALLLSVIAAATASAEGTTAFTCKATKAGGAGFSDEHCTKAVSTGATFSHEEIPPGTATKFKSTNNETGSTTSTFRFKGTLAGVAFELSATGVVSEGTITNEVLDDVMQSVGKEITVHFTGVKVTAPAGIGCKVKEETLLTNRLRSVTVEGTSPTTTGVKYEPELVGQSFLGIKLEGCSNPELNGTFPVTGAALATPEGATLDFTEASTAGLKFGGNKASLTGKLTRRMAPETGKEENPIALTTTAP